MTEDYKSTNGYGVFRCEHALYMERAGGRHVTFGFVKAVWLSDLWAIKKPTLGLLSPSTNALDKRTKYRR